MSVIILTSFTLLVLCATTNGQQTVMRPTTTTSTLTCTTTTSTICLTTKGPVPPCRKRRQFWIDEPIFLMPPESFIQPTNIFQVEPTAVPMDAFKSDRYFYPVFNDGAYLYPSMMVPVNNYQPDSYVNFLANDLYRKDPLFQRQKTRTSKKTTVLYTRTKTITENEMSTKTNTIAISGCTPSPLPYDWCLP